MNKYKPGYKTSEFWFTLVSFIFSGLYLTGLISENDQKEELITIVSHAVESCILIGGQAFVFYKYISARQAVKQIDKPIEQEQKENSTTTEEKEEINDEPIRNNTNRNRKNNNRNKSSSTKRKRSGTKRGVENSTTSSRSSSKSNRKSRSKSNKSRKKTDSSGND